jgi:hypothetical protein
MAVERGPKAYAPQPIDTSFAKLPDDLAHLVELLAENAHEVWAASRLAEGWRWGPGRSDKRKEHPCLVPYAELPDSEKEYDRGTALSTLKLTIALGYRIVREP